MSDPSHSNSSSCICRCASMLFVFSCIVFGPEGLMGQGCSSVWPPTNLRTTEVPGSGFLLEWDPIPGSVGVRIYGQGIGTGKLYRNLAGIEPQQYLLPYTALDSTCYRWTLRAACSASPPFDLTPLAEADSFCLGYSGGVDCPISVLDVEGHAYGVVAIGGRCWTTGNLQSGRFANGDSIALMDSDSVWSTATGPAASVYGNDPDNRDDLGYLYNGFAVQDARGLCPSGWHVPNEADWDALVLALGGPACAAGPMKLVDTAMAVPGAWYPPNLGASNAAQFSAGAGGLRDGDGNFGYTRSFGFWWSATEYPIYPSTMYYRLLSYYLTNVERGNYPKTFGMSVRCVQD